MVHAPHRKKASRELERHPHLQTLIALVSLVIQVAMVGTRIRENRQTEPFDTPSLTRSDGCRRHRCRCALLAPLHCPLHVDVFLTPDQAMEESSPGIDVLLLISHFASCKTAERSSALHGAPRVDSFYTLREGMGGEGSAGGSQAAHRKGGRW